MKQFKTTFKIPQMDCSAEENLIRMKLVGFEQIQKLDFDLNQRTLIIFHEGNSDSIQKSIQELNLGNKIVDSQETDELIEEESNSQKRILWLVLIINFLFFLIEITTGLISQSMGLVADSLDMLADSSVYALSLFAVGGAVSRKKKIARFAGYIQVALAALGFFEVLNRFLGTELMPDFSTMIVISVLALLANGFCLYLLQKSKSKEAHMQVSMIFTSNDIIINLGVILAGFLVMWTHSNLPDLIVGSIVFIIVMRGAMRILKLGK